MLGRLRWAVGHVSRLPASRGLFHLDAKVPLVTSLPPRPPAHDQAAAPVPGTGSGSPDFEPGYRFISTPWPGLGAYTIKPASSAVITGQVMSISSGDHRVASALLREWHDHLQLEQHRPAWVTCSPDRFTSPESLVAWARSPAERGTPVFIDNFPDVGGRHRVFDPDEDEYDRITEDDVISWTVTALHQVARAANGLIVLGARMADGAETAIGRDIENHLVRGDGVVESRCRTSMLAYSDPETLEPWGWLYSHPHGDHLRQIRRWFPLREPS